MHLQQHAVASTDEVERLPRKQSRFHGALAEYHLNRPGGIWPATVERNLRDQSLNALKCRNGTQPRLLPH